MIVRVAAALRAFGSWKLGTPLLTASTPVSAVQPLAKARSARKTVSRPPVRWSGMSPYEALSAVRVEPVASRSTPTARRSSTAATKP